MNKILTALKFFKDHTNNLKASGGQHKRSDKKESQTKPKDKENQNEKGRDSALSKDGESRPRTSRGKRAKQRRKSGSNNNSALGFHSKLPHHILNQGGDGKNHHNRSVNIAGESPRSKSKRKLKDRISPNMMVATQNKNVSIEAEKLAILNKSRPRSAKLKKKGTKTAERSKKGSATRHNNSMIAKPDFYPNNMPDGNMIFEDPSFDQDDRNLKIFAKKHPNMPKMQSKVKTSYENFKTAKVNGSKFNIVKGSDSQQKSLLVAYEHPNYLEDFHRMHQNIEEMMKNKHNLKFDQKKKKAGLLKKKSKHKRSATPALSMAQGYLAN